MRRRSAVHRLIRKILSFPEALLKHATMRRVFPTREETPEMLVIKTVGKLRTPIIICFSIYHWPYYKGGSDHRYLYFIR